MDILLDTRACCKNILSLSKQFEAEKITKEDFLRGIKPDVRILIGIVQTLREEDE